MKNTNRKIEIDIFDILDLINAADSYGYGDDVLLCTCAEWLESLSDDEIEEYASTFVSKESLEMGYTEEDKEEAKEQLIEFRRRYWRQLGYKNNKNL